MQQGPGLQASNPASRAGSPNAKRQKTDGGGASSSSAAAAGSSSAAAGSSSTAFSAAGAADDEEEVEKQLQCGICQDILYKPVAVQPCMHVFCGACFCEWMKRAHNCPQCRQPVRVVARNHTVANIVDAYLAQHPNKARDPTETARLDAEDTIGNVPRAIRQRDREEGMEMFEYSAGGGANDEDDYSGSDGGDYSDDDDDGGLMDMIMAQARANAAAAGLPPDQAAHAAAFAHLQALQARAAPPLVAAPRTPCASCTGLFPSHRLQTYDTPHVIHIPPTALGNTYERQILVDYYTAKGMTLDQLFADIKAKCADGTFTMPPPLANPGTSLTLTSSVCQPCFSRGVNHLLLQYRKAIPNSELPEAVTRRQNCWYGQGCRTMTHNRQHAERLNHICEATRGPGSAAAHGGPP